MRRRSARADIESVDEPAESPVLARPRPTGAWPAHVGRAEDGVSESVEAPTSVS